jgi:methionine-rich copper-binding protein CopC
MTQQKKLRINASAKGAACAVALVWLAVGTAQTVSAHAGYESSTPGDGEVVAESPEVIDIIFGQEMARSGGLPTVVVMNDAGDQVDLGATLDDADRTHISVEMPPALPDGRYTVIWHTLSDEDGEEAQGAFHFFVGAAPTPVPTGDASETQTIPGRPSPSFTEQPTAEPSGDGEGEGVSVWLVVVGVVAGLVVGGGGATLLARKQS